MNLLREQLQQSPTRARVLPFFIFLIITAFQGESGSPKSFWLCLLKTLLGAWMIWEMRPLVKEMRWAFSWEAVVVGVGVCVIWVGLDPYYPPNHLIFQPIEGEEWNPNNLYGQGSAMAWFFIAVRILGSSLVVPPIEEVFYRSYVYRIMISNKWELVPIGYFAGASFLACSALFGLMHFQWLAGILCGMAYLWLTIHKKRLGDAMTAHAITNFLLGVWVVWKGQWQFW
jgi:hypothetical protein